MGHFLASIDNYGLWITGVVGGLAALAAAVRWVRKTVRRIRKFANDVDDKVTALNDLAQYELRHNGGGSLKDHAAMVPELAERIAAVESTLGDHLLAATSEQTSMWSAIEAIAKAQPPEEVKTSDPRH